MKELAKDPVDLNEYLRIAEADIVANNDDDEPEERRNVITIVQRKALKFDRASVI